MNSLYLRGSLIASITFSTLVYTSNALSLDEDFRLLGLAMHQETGRDIYLGAIHLTGSAPTPDNVAQSRAPKMMEYRIVARRTSIRSLVGKMLLQSEVANGAPPSAEVIEFADKLLSSVQGSLYAGDSFEIKQSSPSQVAAVLNDTELTSSEDSGIFNYLLKGWVSESGPSTAFRSSILMQDLETDMLASYQAIAPSEERVAAVSDWFATEPEPTELPQAIENEVPAQAIAANKPPNNTEEIAEEAKVAPNASDIVVIEQVADITEPEEVSVLPDTKQAESLVAQLDTAVQTDTNIAVAGDHTDLFEPGQETFFEPSLDSGSIVNTSSAPSLDSSFEATEVWTFEDNTRLEPAVLPDFLENEPFDILSLDVTQYSYRLAQFNNALLRLVYSKISYPRRAVRRSIQGALELDVTVLEDGSLVEVAIVESSGYSILDDAAVKAAQQALTDKSLGEIDPVVVAEYGINGNLVIPVPVNFVLQD